MTNPHEKLAMEFFSPPGPSARQWQSYTNGDGYSVWVDGAKRWPAWHKHVQYSIALKPQTITLPERAIPKPLDVEELVDGEWYWMIDPTQPAFVLQGMHIPRLGYRAERGLYYPYTDQGCTDAIAAAKGMIGRDDGSA